MKVATEESSHLPSRRSASPLLVARFQIPVLTSHLPSHCSPSPLLAAQFQISHSPLPSRRSSSSLLWSSLSSCFPTRSRLPDSPTGFASLTRFTLPSSLSSPLLRTAPPSSLRTPGLHLTIAVASQIPFRQLPDAVTWKMANKQVNGCCQMLVPTPLGLIKGFLRATDSSTTSLSVRMGGEEKEISQVPEKFRSRTLFLLLLHATHELSSNWFTFGNVCLQGGSLIVKN